MTIEKHCPFKRGLRKVFCPWPSAHNILLLLAVLYLLSLARLTASELADWVQAIGSIAAIMGAFYISQAQQRYQDRRRGIENSERVSQIQNIFTKIANSQKTHLEFLRCTLLDVQENKNEDQLKRYFYLGLDLHWEPNIEALRDFSLTDLADSRVEMVNELKVGAEFAKRLCFRLLEFGVSGVSLQEEIERLRHHESVAEIALNNLRIHINRSKMQSN
jgi:hypothetical protein